MAKKTTRNNDLLRDTKKTTSPKIYALLVEAVNRDREDLAEDILKVDYLLNYTSTCIKDRDKKQALSTIEMVKNRIDKLEQEDVNTEYLVYLYEGIKAKI